MKKMKVKRFLIFSVSVFIVLCLQGCIKDAVLNCFECSGEPVIVERPLEWFSRIDIDDVMDVVLVQDSFYKVEIIAPANLQDNIVSQISDSVLHIRDETKCTWNKRYERIKVYIHFKTLEKIAMYATGTLTNLDTLNLDKFVVWGIADVNDIRLNLNCDILTFLTSETSIGHYSFSGNCRFGDIWPKYASVIDARYLKINDLLIVSTSIADMHFNIRDNISYAINAKGIVYYSGSPILSQESGRTSTGQLIKEF